MNRDLKSRSLFKICLFTIFTVGLAIGCYVCVNSFNSDKSKAGSQPIKENGTIFQSFEWDTVSDGNLWNHLENDVEKLTNAGITSFWLPPAYKGHSGWDVGYGVYDLYDLGEFYQKKTVRTKYGYKQQYLNLINTIHKNGGSAYADIVMNHRGGGDSVELVEAARVDANNTNRVISSYGIHKDFLTVFTFPGRNKEYSSFTWNASHFDGYEHPSEGIYLFKGKSWDKEVSKDNGNADFIMMCDYDFENGEVVNELLNWGRWYCDTTKIDGFRLDAVKHIQASFMRDWLSTMRYHTGKEMFAVGEYFDGNVNVINSYLESVNQTMSIFDYPLYYKMREASKNGIDMKSIFDNTLSSTNPTKAVTFVDNHDVQCSRNEKEFPVEKYYVQDWFKPIGYTMILTREAGYPCVFSADYYGSNDGHISAREGLINRLLKARKEYAYGTQHEYLDNCDVIGWTREGDYEHNNSGLAALVTDGNAGSKYMYVGKKHVGETWVDITGNSNGKVSINYDGCANFYVNTKSCAVWVKEGDFGQKRLNNNGGIATVYYKTKWNNTYIHYQVGNGAWTDVPGLKMTKSDRAGYVKYVIDLGTAVTARGCFNDGDDTWDDRDFDNYVFGNGVTTINGTDVSFREYYSNESKDTPSDEAQNVVNKSNFVTIYYKTDWETPYIHFVIGNGSWTQAPGRKMYISNFSGYVKDTIELGTEKNITFCFNNGDNWWDSRDGNNYSGVVGEYTVEGGQIRKGKPQ